MATAPLPTPPKGERWVVTGGAGFIGSHLCRALAADPAVVGVTAFDDLSRGKAERLPNGVRLVQASILDDAALDRALDGADVVAHLAALTSVVECETDPARCTAVNATGSRRVLEAAARAGARRVVFASTCAVYGDRTAPPVAESAPPSPQSAYARSKLAAEALLKQPASTAGASVAVVLLRFFNVYGPGQDPKSPYAAAVPIFLSRALAGEPLVLHGGGGQTRDFVHVSDAVRAIRLAASAPASVAAGGTFNVGSGKAITIRHLAEAIVRRTGSQSPLVAGPPRTGDVRDSWADTRAAEASLGFRAQVGLDDGLDTALAAMKAETGPPRP